jgi:hypothetical protein
MDIQQKRELSNNILRSLFGEKQIAKWWQSPNKAFNLQKPEDVWQTNSDKIFNYLKLQISKDY